MFFYVKVQNYKGDKRKTINEKKKGRETLTIDKVRTFLIVHIAKS